jgi:hypothetical protein
VTGYIFSNASIKSETELIDDLRNLIRGATDTFIQEILKRYPANEYDSTFYRRQTILGDMFVDCPTSWMMAANIKKKKGAWKLFFDTGSQLHGSTAEFLFDPNYESKSSIVRVNYILTKSKRKTLCKLPSGRIHERLVSILRISIRSQPLFMAGTTSRRQAKMAYIWRR